jgi:hypothetical protein
MLRRLDRLSVSVVLAIFPIYKRLSADGPLYQTPAKRAVDQGVEPLCEPEVLSGGAAFSFDVAITSKMVLDQ